MNRHDIEEKLKSMTRRVELIDKDLTTLSVELSAVSQVALIVAKTEFQASVKSLQAMLDLLDFDEIVGEQFNK